MRTQNIVTPHPLGADDEVNPATPSARSALIYIGLTFALSTPFWAAGALSRRQILPAIPVSALGLVCMGGAAAILVYRERGRAGVVALLKRAFDAARVRSKIWYVPTILLMPGIMVLSYVAMRLMGVAPPAPQISLTTALILFSVFFIAAIGEELGWSGYAIDPLQERYGALGGALLLGVAWAVWHVIPLLSVPRTPMWVAWWSLGTVAARVIIVWLYNNTGRSVFVAVLFHTMINLTWQLFPINGSFYDPRVTSVIMACVAVVVVIVWGPQRLVRDQIERGQRVSTTLPDQDATFRAALPAAITKSASKQTYYTIRYLVDRKRRADAYRAYAYFRWVDDQLDQTLADNIARIAFVERQVHLVDRCYTGDWPDRTSGEERMLVDLVRNDPQQSGGLHAYIQHLMAVMAFDAQRRGRLITADELADYSLYLAAAVTEALHYFIGHDNASPHGPERYLAVTAAHITHMLRDTCEDVAAGYFNIPSDVLEAARIGPESLASDPYKAWVKRRVELARDHFKAGRHYLARVKSLRCRLAGYAYIERFEGVLSSIAQDGYLIKPAYPQRKRLPAVISMIKLAIAHSLGMDGPHLRGRS
jgi:membrane protease YdiL (CAAX protease family)/phytoene/squalene synthetase